MTVSKKRAEAVRKCIERIDADPGEHWDPKKLAEECGMPYATFRRRFEAAVGCPVYQYIRFRRLQKSAGILRKGGGIAAAMEHSGFETVSGFYKAFQSVYGVSHVVFAETRGRVRMTDPERKTVKKFRVSGRLYRCGRPSEDGTDIFPEIWSGAEEEIYRTLREETDVMSICRREPPEYFVCTVGKPIPLASTVAGAVTAGGEYLRFPVPDTADGPGFFDALHAVWLHAVRCRLPQEGLRRDERRISFVSCEGGRFGLWIAVRPA
jgi:AraC-like DNA-binding protein